MGRKLRDIDGCREVASVRGTARDSRDFSPRGKGITVMYTNILVMLLLVMFVFSCSASREHDAAGKLVVFHAGSLSVPMREIAEAFEREHPGVEVVCEAAGSRACARKITDLGRECDVMASADYTVIDELLIPGYATWNIKFAANEMALVYHGSSRMAGDIDPRNWYEILLRGDVAFGRSDPDMDPCGYRTVLTLELAETYYGIEGLAGRLLGKDTQYIRPKETDLLALLETGAIDYIFLYRSVAEQHGLEYLLLPDEINLERPEFAEQYAAASVEVSGREPGTTITKRGAPMVYGVTIPSNAPNRELAIEFVAFMLDSSKGLRIMERNGQPALVPSPTDTYGMIPERLRAFALPAE
jgi:molybdate/tungstate transport system substrate-binding protein